MKQKLTLTVERSAVQAARRTARIVQPLVSAERWLITREASPRETIATQLGAQARIDLASRLFNAVPPHLHSRFLHNLPVGIGGSDVGHSTNAIDDVPEPPDGLVLVKGFGVLQILDCRGTCAGGCLGRRGCQ